MTVTREGLEAAGFIPPRGLACEVPGRWVTRDGSHQAAKRRDGTWTLTDRRTGETVGENLTSLHEVSRRLRERGWTP